MLKIFVRQLLPIIYLFSLTNALASDCFLAKENGKVLTSEGDCITSYAPNSTFKIVLSLIGFDSGILQNDNDPIWDYKNYEKNYDYYINICKGSHNPHSWMRDSCLWYSQVITDKLGMKKFKQYIKKFKYGNMDLSGEKGKDNGLLYSWISSSLQISPEQQVSFIQKIIDKKLSISKDAYDKTKQVMFVQEFVGGWKLYGKTGSGLILEKNGKKTDLQQGWFVGWIEKNHRKVVFASHVSDSAKRTDSYASFRARNEALIKLWYLINNELEK